MIIRGSQLRGYREYRGQVLVIGSGAAGAVVAKELSEEGFDVLIFEEGEHIPPEEYGKMHPTKSIRRLSRSSGVLAALGVGASPSIGIMAGCCVGGSSVLTGGVCFRIPEQVHSHWEKLLDSSEFSYTAMEPYYRRVEEISSVREVPTSLRSRGTELFGIGAEKLGVKLLPLHRNAPDCKGCSRCTFGCPEKAKLSVDLTYLPQALKNGTKLYSEHRIDKILTRGDRAVGVQGKILDKKKRKVVGTFKAYGQIVVLAAGALFSPLLLFRTGLRRKPGVGSGLTLHPAFRICAFFDQPVYNWKGALQSAYCRHPTEEKLKFISVMAPPGALISTFPGVGPELNRMMREFPYLATFGGMVHDEPGGKLWGRLLGTPLVSYKMDSRDLRALLEGIRFMAEAYFAAGAKRVLLPILGAPALDSIDQLKKFDFQRVDPRLIECLSFHPQGSAAMATDPSKGPVSRDGELFYLRDLWLADASVFPTSVGVNTQIAVMTMATRIAFKIAERLRKN